MPNSVLIVDDEEGIRQTLAGVLEDEGISVDVAASGEDCLRAFERRVFACVLLDVWLPGIDGIETLEKLKTSYPETAVIMISGHGSIETAVRATRLGALDFIEKPLQIERTILAIRNALRQRELEAENQRLREQLDDYAMIGAGVSMRALRQQIAVAAPTGGRILIYGESGTERNWSPAPFIGSPQGVDALRRAELCGNSRGADRVGAFRPHQGRVHGCDSGKAR
jgi:two-component system nitrogen regulation response regulator NtrX